jgi:hypothetical protein
MGDTDNASKHSSNNSDSEDDFYDVNDDCHIIERDKTSWEDGEVLLVDEDDQKVAKKGQNWKNGPPEGDEEEGESGEGDEAGDVDGAGDGDEAGHGDENNEEEEEMDEKAAKKAEKKEKKKKKRQEMDTREVQVEYGFFAAICTQKSKIYEKFMEIFRRQKN